MQELSSCIGARNLAPAYTAAAASSSSILSNCRHSKNVLIMLNPRIQQHLLLSVAHHDGDGNFTRFMVQGLILAINCSDGIPTAAIPEILWWLYENGATSGSRFNSWL